MSRMCIFSLFSIFLILKSTLHFKHTSKPFPIHLGISFILKSSFTSYLLSKPFHEPNTILIWVTTHTYSKHRELLEFVLNPNSITYNLTMSSIKKGDSLLILFLMGFTNLNFKKSKVKMQFNQNPRFGDKHLIIQSLTIPYDPYKIHTQSSFHTKNPKFHTLACLA